MVADFKRPNLTIYMLFCIVLLFYIFTCINEAHQCDEVTYNGNKPIPTVGNW